MSNSFQNAPTKTIDAAGSRFVYREIGQPGGIPMIFLNHLTAVLDDWDPRVVDGIAQHHHVIVFDNRGVGGSGGLTPTSVAEMARDAIAVIDALGFKKIDLFGFSLGGFVAQSIAHQRPELVRKLVLAGTGPAGGHDIEKVAAVLSGAMDRAKATGKQPKHLLFFGQSARAQKGAEAFLKRLGERLEDRDQEIQLETIKRQLVAIEAWGNGPATDLESLTHPVLVANGDDDVMVPTVNSWELFRRLPNAKLSIFPDAGHGGVFEYHAEFVPQVLDFLAA
jgi:pimeloyl-ACP methyl ester carboxylesterase